ncbi:STAS domain-containing protein [Embleya scabrispora]
MSVAESDLVLTVHTPRPGAVVVDVRGHLDHHTAPRLRGRGFELIDRGLHHVVLNLAGLRFSDSTGLAVLVALHHRTRAHRGSIAVAAPPERFRRMLRVTGLSLVIAEHDDVDHALAAIETDDAPARCAAATPARTDTAKPPDPAPAGGRGRGPPLERRTASRLARRPFVSTWCFRRDGCVGRRKGGLQRRVGEGARVGAAGLAFPSGSGVLGGRCALGCVGWCGVRPSRWWVAVGVRGSGAGDFR